MLPTPAKKLLDLGVVSQEEYDKKAEYLTELGMGEKSSSKTESSGPTHINSPTVVSEFKPNHIEFSAEEKR